MEQHGQAAWPEIPARGTRREDLVGRDLPALARHLPEPVRGRAVDGHLDVVHRPVGRAVVGDARFRKRRVLAGIPPGDGEVNSPDEGEVVVEDHQLLVMRGIEGVLGIELDGDARMALPLRAEQQGHRRAGAVHHRDAPDEDAHFEVGLRLDQTAQRRAERFRRVGVGLQADPPVEVPADDEDRPFGLADGLVERAEIIGGVHHHAGARRPLHAPARHPGLQHAGNRQQRVRPLHLRGHRHHRRHRLASRSEPPRLRSG